MKSVFEQKCHCEIDITKDEYTWSSCLTSHLEVVLADWAINEDLLALKYDSFTGETNTKERLSGTPLEAVK
jgi:hypothetical protein